LSAAVLALALAIAAPPPVRVGSKAFTESVLLGDLASGLLSEAGVRAEHRRALGGTRILWSALLRGDLDLYPEYTGTLVREILGLDREPAPEELADLLARRGVGLTRSLGFDDSYRLGVREEAAARLALRSMSDLARHPELRFGLTNEFMDRADGWPAVRARYRLQPSEVHGLAHDVAYRALAGGEIDVTDVYSTDPEIEQHRLALLEDDRGAFPEYQAVFVHRLDLAARAPAALGALRRLEGRIPAETMRRLNGDVQLRHRPSEQVAAALLQQLVGSAPAVRPDGIVKRVLRRTAEHLVLVGLALAAAVAVGVPLGIAARRRGVGRVALGIAGLVQTIPSLALLVFMIPLLGIGSRPAVAALFLYGLLPIVRGTHSGLTGISPELRESAQALGLPPAARLRRVELPLAMPSILAGVKTSAVIMVGTATLGALIGAGGYGQPILTGLRLDSVPLILEGAVPAAALALLAEAAFGLLERVIVSRGLRYPTAGLE
jgi:osmoprotectant transport system permease protein